MNKPYRIEDYKNAQAFVVKKQSAVDNKDEMVANFYYDDKSVPKEMVERAANIFTNSMNELNASNVQARSASSVRV